MCEYMYACGRVRVYVCVSLTQLTFGPQDPRTFAWSTRAAKAAAVGRPLLCLHCGVLGFGG